MTAERTLVLCKPDAVERGLVGEIVGRIERKGLTIVALELRMLDEGTAKQHYAEHDGKPFFDDLVAFITRSPLVAMVVEGPEAWKVMRTLMGATNPREARRARFAAISRSSSPRTSCTEATVRSRPRARLRCSFQGSRDRFAAIGESGAPPIPLVAWAARASLREA